MTTIVQMPDIVLGTIEKLQYPERLLINAINATKPQKTYLYNSSFTEPIKLPDGSVTNTKVSVNTVNSIGVVYQTDVYYNRYSSKDLGPVSIKVTKEVTMRDTVGSINAFLSTFIPPEIVSNTVLTLPNGVGITNFNVIFIQNNLQYYSGKRVKLLYDPIDPPPLPGDEVQPTYSAAWQLTQW